MFAYDHYFVVKQENKYLCDWILKDDGSYYPDTSSYLTDAVKYTMEDMAEHAMNRAIHITKSNNYYVQKIGEIL